MKIRLFLILLSCILLMSSAAAGEGGTAVLQDGTVISAENMEAQTVVTLNGTDVSAEGPGAEIGDEVITITEAGTYLISGRTESHRLIVDAGKQDEVTLILRNAEILSADDTALAVKKAGSVTLRLGEDSVNRIVSGTEREITQKEKTDEETSASPALSFKAALTITGTGSLYAESYADQAIRATKDLSIEDGTVTITAVGTGIRCKGTLTVNGGTLSIRSGGDGIHAGSKGSDEKEADGALIVSGGSVSVESFEDALESETILTVLGGTVSVKTNGGAANAPEHESEFGMGMPFGTQQTAEEDDTVSAKGLKSANELMISGGDISIDAYDDAIHAGGTVSVSGGKLTAASGDDGIHSDTLLIISGGKTVITRSYEGLEGFRIEISGGVMEITSDDDGINASDGSGGGFGFTDPMGNRPGQAAWNNGDSGTLPIIMPDASQQPNGADAQDGNPFGTPPSFDASGQNGMPFGTPPSFGASESTATQTVSDSTELPMLLISGGTVYVNARGDGLDSNGDILITGGNVVVDGPDNSMNGALDSGTENGGTLHVTGGTVFAIGALGMSETFDESSEQAVLNAVSRWNAGDELVFTDSEGNELVRHTAARSGQSIVYTDPALKDGDVVTVTIGDTSAQVTVGGSAGGSFSYIKRGTN